jgi:hypothetical protein
MFLHRYLPKARSLVTEYDKPFELCLVSLLSELSVSLLAYYLSSLYVSPEPGGVMCANVGTLG